VNILEPTLTLALTMNQINALTGALDYVNHPAFAQVRNDILEQVRGPCVEL
jgi:hypothetical protein